SWPNESMPTGMALALFVATPRMLPIKQLPPTFAPEEPIAITPRAVVTQLPASAPTAMLKPCIAFASAPEPTATFEMPVTSLPSALNPMAVLLPTSLREMERTSAHRCVVAGGVARQRLKTNGCVVAALCVAIECARTVSRVVAADCVGGKCCPAGGGVVVGRVVKEGHKARSEEQRLN